MHANNISRRLKKQKIMQNIKQKSSKHLILPNKKKERPTDTGNKIYQHTKPISQTKRRKEQLIQITKYINTPNQSLKQKKKDKLTETTTLYQNTSTHPTVPSNKKVR